MRPVAYDKFSQLTSDIKLPIVEVLRQRKAELWQLVKNQRDPTETARLQGKMDELDQQIEKLTIK